MTLTLTRTLEIDIKLIPVEEDKALQLARQLWAFDRRPIAANAAQNAIQRRRNKPHR